MRSPQIHRVKVVISQLISQLIYGIVLVAEGLMAAPLPCLRCWRARQMVIYRDLVLGPTTSSLWTRRHDSSPSLSTRRDSGLHHVVNSSGAPGAELRACGAVLS